MEIEYIHNFWDNTFPSGISLLKLYLLIIPGYFLVQFLKHKRSLTNLFLFLILSTLLLIYEYHSINSRFNTLTYSKDNLQINLLSGEKHTISPKSINFFRSISIGRSGGYACYLFIKTDTDEYRGVNVIKREHSCKDDAELLNDYFNKR